MRTKNVIRVLSVMVVTFVFFATLPFPGYASLQGTQLALNGVNAADAESAKDDKTKSNQTKTETSNAAVSSKDTPSNIKEQKPEASSNVVQETTDIEQNSAPKSIEDEIKELKKEIKKLRGENEARKKLEAPAEEKSQSVEDILSAAGRQYSLLRKGTVGLSYTFGYSYFSGDAIDELSDGGIGVRRRVNHNINNTIAVEYALLNNLTLSSNIPFIYKYDKVGTAESLDVTDLGDINLGVAWQPFKAGGSIPATIVSFGVSLPTGSSPYEINYENELSTGSGHYGVSLGVSLSKVVDPLVAFGNFSYSYSIPESGLSHIIYEDPTNPASKIYLTEVKPGGSLGLAFGFGYALSYQASMNLSAQFGYSFGSEYTNESTTGGASTSKTGSSLSSSLNIGTGWRITAARSISTSVGIGLTNNDSDVSLSLRFPFEF